MEQFEAHSTSKSRESKNSLMPYFGLSNENIVHSHKYQPLQQPLLEVCKQTELLTLSNYFRYILEEITNQRDENTSSFVQLDISLNPNSFSVRVSRALTSNAGGSFFHETAQFSSHITYICNHQASQSGSQSVSKIVFNGF